MTINALNSGAKVWLADMEDSSTPTWRNVIKGQLNLTDALERRIDFTSEEGKEYKLKPAGDLPTIVVRPRGWHLPEKHMLIDGQPIAGGIVDFGLFFFHNARRLLAQGSALRFLLTRLYDWLHTPAGALVKPKDPLEYLHKIRFHRNVADIGAYGLR